MNKEKVGKYSNQIRGVSYKNTDLHDSLNGESVILLRANNIFDNEINFDSVVYVDKARVSQKQYLQKGDIVVCASSGSKNLVGKAAQVNFDSKVTFGAFLKVVRPKNILSKYLGYYFLSNEYRRKISSIAEGANINNIRNEHIDDLMVSVVDKDTQKKISEILEKVNGIVKSRKQQLLDYDQLIKSRFVEIFGDVLVNDRSWPVHKWNDVLLIKNGKNQKKVENKTGKYPICGSGGVMSFADDYICNENSVIIGRKGNINNPIIMREKYWNVDTAFGLEPHINRINVDYLYLFCNFYDFLKHNKTVTIPSLTKTDLLKIDIPTPPIRLQNEFSQFVQQVDKLKFEDDVLLVKLRDIRLLQILLYG